MDRCVYVTVGTTAFDALIQTVVSDDVLNTLISQGYTKLLLQTGRGTFDVHVNRSDIEIQSYKFKESIHGDIKNADIVISHAGAGSILETLALHKPLIVVINDKLMDNHQYELAAKMFEEGVLYYCTCDSLNQTLKEKDLSKLKSMPPANPQLFGDYMVKLMNINI